jgi:quinol monooxygenase YgiN
MTFFVFVRFKVKPGTVNADENAVILFEKYVDQAAFEIHRSMNYLKIFRSAVTELFDGEPLIIRGSANQAN